MAGPAPLTREVRGAGLLNLRDLGGLPLAGGRAVRRRRLLRAATLVWATPDDVQRLVADVGVRRLVDLRTDREIERDGRPEAVIEGGIRWVRRPLSVPGKFLDGRRGVPAPSHYAREYARLAEIAGPVVGEVLEAAAGGETLIFACTTGKDRTGVLAALILSLLGVARAEVVADFMLTGEALAGRHEAFARMISAKRISEEEFAGRLRPRADAVTAFLDGIDARHGSVAGWAAANGIGPVVAAAVPALTVDVPDRDTSPSPVPPGAGPALPIVRSR